MSTNQKKTVNKLQKTLVLITLSIFIIAQCKPEPEEPNYSPSFRKYVEQKGFFLSNDSIFQKAQNSESADFIMSFPFGLQKNKVYHFQNDSNLTLELRQKNYTDLELLLKQPNISIEATLKPDIFQYAYAIQHDSNEVRVNAFSCNLKECTGLVLLSKKRVFHELKQDSIRLLTIRIQDDSCGLQNLSKINGLYLEQL